MHARLVVVVVMILLPSLASTYSILAMLSLGTKSHFTVLRPLLEELMARGHNITLLSICPSNLQGIEEYVLDDVSDPLSTLSNPFDDSSSKIATFMNLYNIFEELEDNVRYSCGTLKYDTVGLFTVNSIFFAIN